MNELLDRLNQMYRMAVWSERGTMYMPLYDYDGQIVAYGRALDALELWENDLLEVLS